MPNSQDSTPLSKSGIYAITCNVNGKFYIGSAVDFAHRERNHRHELERGKHHCRHLQSAWKKYGAESFEWSILELVSIKGLTKAKAKLILLAREQYFIDTLDAVRSGFNCSPNAGSQLGVKHTVKARANMVKACRLKWQDPVCRAHYKEGGRLKWQDPAFRAKQAEGWRRRKLAKRAKAKLVQLMLFD